MRTVVIAISCVVALACSPSDRDGGTTTADGAVDKVEVDATSGTGNGVSEGMDSLTTTAAVSLDEKETFPADITSRTIPYSCDDGRMIAATYLSADSGSVSLVILRWDGKAYGLAQAISASGARYASLYGPTPADHGMEWWEAKGEARLGAFTGTDLTETRPLLTGCKPGV